MERTNTGQPETTEYAPHFSRYVGLVNEEDIVTTLDNQRRATLNLLGGIDAVKADFRYEPGKWTVKEVIGHIIDTERVFAFRAFYIGRNNQNPLPGFDQDVTSESATYQDLSLSEIIDEYDCVRRTTIHLFGHFDEDSWLRRGVANNNEITVRALAYVTLGHERHHLEILKKRYLQAP